MKLSRYFKIWILAFTYTMLAGLFIQLVLLKYIFPEWNAGAGMLNGLDAPFYHGLALNLYEKMAAQGWPAWQLFPEKQVVSGITAVFYYLIAPQPWAVLPLHAALNASACTALFFLMLLISDNEGCALAAILPFLLFPSALQWNAQLNNDVYSIPGVLLFMAGWAAIFVADTAAWKKKLFALCMLMAGFGLVYLTRPYLGLPFSMISLVLLVGYGIKSIPGLLKSTRGKFTRGKTAGMGWFLLVCLVVFGMLPFAQNGLAQGAGWETRMDCNNAANLTPQCRWQVAGWLPGSLDRQFKRLGMSRFMNLRQWQGGTSNIDADVNFFNAASLIKYLPRALQIGMFAPFPNMWFGSGSLPSNTLMRRVSGFEMLIVYFCLAGLIPGFYLARKKSTFYVMILICTAFLMLYGLVVPNIGTLYRFRYPFLMSLVALGLFAWLLLIKNLRQNRRAQPVQANPAA